MSSIFLEGQNCVERIVKGDSFLKNQGVISLGEAFVDYVSTETSNRHYQNLLGGASVNLAVGIRRLGIPSYYLCKLGTDEISQFVEREFIKEDINTEFAVRTPSKKICGVYVHLDENGERYFHSYINPTPDEVLTEDELGSEVFEKARIFYFGSGTLFQNTARKTTETALVMAKNSSNLIAFDANLRLKRWESEEHCRKTVLTFLHHADIVKLSEDELKFLMETETLVAGLEKLFKWEIPFLFITLGQEGAIGIMGGSKIFVPAPQVQAIDTNGAGDAFMAGLLYCFHEKGKPTDQSQIEEFLQFANGVGAMATTQVGALTGMMNLRELETLKSRLGCKS